MSNYHAERTIRAIQQSLRDTMPDKSPDGEFDFFILYPTMKPIATLCRDFLRAANQRAAARGCKHGETAVVCPYCGTELVEASTPENSPEVK